MLYNTDIVGKGCCILRTARLWLRRDRKYMEDVEEFLCVCAALNIRPYATRIVCTMVNIESRTNMPGIAIEFTQRSWAADGCYFVCTVYVWDGWHMFIFTLFFYKWWKRNRNNDIQWNCIKLAVRTMHTNQLPVAVCFTCIECDNFDVYC